MSDHDKQYEAMGYALATRVLQSDLYAKLDDRERAECDALLTTVARLGDYQSRYYVPIDFARQLERELAEAQRKLEVWSLRYAGLEVLYLAAMKS